MLDNWSESSEWILLSLNQATNFNTEQTTLMIASVHRNHKSPLSYHLFVVERELLVEIASWNKSRSKWEREPKKSNREREREDGEESKYLE